MPYEKCVEYEGKIYCWNSTTKKFCRVVLEDIKTENCPPEVIERIVSILSEEVERKG
jgi:hypothetical protein